MTSGRGMRGAVASRAGAIQKSAISKKRVKKVREMREKEAEKASAGLFYNVCDRGKFPGHHVLARVRCGWTRMVARACKWVRKGDYTYIDTKASKNKAKRVTDG